MTYKDDERKKELEIPDTWIDFLMYPIGILAGALLAVIVELVSR